MKNSRIDILKKRISNDVGPLIKIIRSVYHSAEASANVTIEELKKQRRFIESIAHIAFTHTRIKMDRFETGGIPAEWIRPYYGNAANKVILYCHGGGYTCGGLEYAGILGTKFTAHTGLAVLAFAYRLAPENKYPAALEDAVHMWRYLKRVGIKAEDIIVAGDSAGGNLALELCLYLKKQQEKLPLALVLLSPWTDMTASSPTYESEAENDPIVSRTYVHNARTAYLGTDDADYKDPDYSPLFADFEGFPPTLIQVGKNEVLRHDSEALAAKMKKNGVHVKLQVFKAGWHVFQQFPTMLARQAMTEVHIFLHLLIYGRKKIKKDNLKKKKCDKGGICE